MKQAARWLLLLSRPHVSVLLSSQDLAAAAADWGGSARQGGICAAEIKRITGTVSLDRA